MSYYYKSQHASVIAAAQDVINATNALRDEGNKFGELFVTQDMTARAFIAHTFDIRSFHGLKFNPEIKSNLWTKPDKQSGCQRPRSSIKNATQEERNELKQLLTLWKDNCPKKSINLDKFFKSLGVDYGDFLFNGIIWFVVNDSLYINTHALIKQNVEEILGSEYESARKQYQGKQS